MKCVFCSRPAYSKKVPACCVCWRIYLRSVREGLIAPLSIMQPSLGNQQGLSNPPPQQDKPKSAS